MLRLMFVYVFSCALVTDAVSQAINFPSYADPSQPSTVCDAGARCVPPKRCRQVLRQFGREIFCSRGGISMVCCVSVRRRLNDTNSSRDPSSPTPDNFPPVPDSPSSNILPDPICGISQPLENGTTSSIPTIEFYSATKQGEYPWMAAVMYRHVGVDNVFCNGFMIDRRHALSAAHCFETPNRPQLYSLRIGDIYYAAGQKYSIAEIKIHEGYKPGKMYNDIAVLKLNKDVDFPTFSPICLPDKDHGMDLEDISYTTASWGGSIPGGLMSPVLQHLHYIPLVPNEACNEIISKGFNGFPKRISKGVTHDFQCAEYSDEEGSTCHGNAGGPLMRQNEGSWIAEGLLSFEFDRSRRLPIGYTRISSFLDWIRQKTQP